MELMSRYATNFAIVDNGIVTSTIWGSIYNASDFPNAVRIDDLAVQVGDGYDGDRFYHRGEVVRTVSEELEDMRSALALLGVTADG